MLAKSLQPAIFLISFLIGPTGSAQTVGSRSASEYMAEMQLVDFEAKRFWQDSKKITVLKTVPKERPEQSASFDGVNSGWVGDLGYWSFRVLSVVDENQLILHLGSKKLIWMIDYPTAEFADGDEVNVVGPVLAGPTKQYTSTAGSVVTVRTFSLLRGAVVAEHEADLDAKYNRRAIEKVVNKLVWGDEAPIKPDRIPKQMQRRYKTVTAKVLRKFELGKVDASQLEPIAVDQKGSEIIYRDESIKQMAIIHYKSMTSPPFDGKKK